MTIIEKEVSEYILKRRQKQLEKGKTLKFCSVCNKNIKYYNFNHHVKGQKHILKQKIYDLENNNKCIVIL